MIGPFLRAVVVTGGPGVEMLPSGIEGIRVVRLADFGPSASLPDRRTSDGPRGAHLDDFQERSQDRAQRVVASVSGVFIY